MPRLLTAAAALIAAMGGASTAPAPVLSADWAFTCAPNDGPATLLKVAIPDGRTLHLFFWGEAAQRVFTARGERFDDAQICRGPSCTTASSTLHVDQNRQGGWIGFDGHQWTFRVAPAPRRPVPGSAPALCG